MQTITINLKFYKQELEDFVCDALAEAVSAHSEVAELRRKCKKYEDAQERFRHIAMALRKQNADLTTVVKRYIVESKEGNARSKVAVPVKITRSVGLTVNTVTTKVRTTSEPV